MSGSIANLITTDTLDFVSTKKDFSIAVLQELSTASTNRWEEIDLGLIQTIFSMWFKNVSQRVSVTLSIICTIVFSLLDNFSDFYVAYALFHKGEVTYACIVIICDYIPGWQLAVHNLSYKSWRSWNNPNQKIVTLIFLLVSPLSLPLFFLQWLIRFNSTDDNTFNYLHHNARLSQLLNGSVESPLQVMLLLILWGEGKLDMPWTRNTVLSDSSGNEINLGALPGMLSLVMSIIVILRGSLEVVESTKWREKLVVCGYALCNFIFRLSSFALSLMYFKEWSALLFGTIFIINVTTIVRYDSTKRKRISVITSAIISIFTPFVSSEEPHLFQWKRTSLKHRQLIEYSRHRRNLSSKIALYTFPPIYASNLALFLLLKYYPSFKYDDNIELNKETTVYILYFLLPIATSALISSISFQKRKLQSSTNDNSGQMNYFSNEDISNFYGGNFLELKENIVHSLRYCGRIISIMLILATAIFAIVFVEDSRLVSHTETSPTPSILEPGNITNVVMKFSINLQNIIKVFLYVIAPCFDVKIVTSNGGYENSWSLGPCKSNQTYENHDEYHEKCCLQYGKYELSCKDTSGDGWEGGYIEINGTKYCNVLKQFKNRKESINIGNSK